MDWRTDDNQYLIIHTAVMADRRLPLPFVFERGLIIPAIAETITTSLAKFPRSVVVFSAVNAAALEKALLLTPDVKLHAALLLEIDAHTDRGWLHRAYKIDGTARKDRAHARLYDAGDGCAVRGDDWCYVQWATGRADIG